MSDNDESVKRLLLDVRADSQSTANTSACWSSPYSSGNGTSPAHTGTVKDINNVYYTQYFTTWLIQSPEYLTSRWQCLCGCFSLAMPTLMLSGRPSSRLLSISLLVIMLTVSSTFGLVLLLSCCSSVPVGTGSLRSILVLYVSAAGLKPPRPFSPVSSDCFIFISMEK